eukprot:864253-Amphidinium_carterae.1
MMLRALQQQHQKTNLKRFQFLTAVRKFWSRWRHIVDMLSLDAACQETAQTCSRCRLNMPQLTSMRHSTKLDAHTVPQYNNPSCGSELHSVPLLQCCTCSLQLEEL